MINDTCFPEDRRSKAFFMNFMSVSSILCFV